MYNKSQGYAAAISILCMSFFMPALFLDTRKPIEYADYIKLFPTFVVGVITAYIAYQQHIVSKQQKNISKNKLNLDLYDKRFAIYEIFLNMSIWSTSIYENSYEPDQLTREAEFLKNRYESNKENYLKHIDDLNAFCEQSRFLMNDEIYSKLSEARRNIFEARGYADSLYDVIQRKKIISENDFEAIQANRMEMIGYINQKNQSFNYVRNFYMNILPNMMKPYLNIPQDVSKD
ncbi:hypothetical protein [Novacetimonas cocois]|uniref:hypothetical protein n=1 Tax=Novacetimonas cocois TaxID=1747507 RepID=UPI00105787A0|nr:hypothetical protein [Novacetimonas cocois]